MKPNYGFDAPNVIRWLFVFAGVSFLAAYFSYSLSVEKNPLFALLFCGYFCLTALAFLVPAAWMLYGTQKGKQKILSDTLDKLHLKGDEKILDAGCGRGLFMIEAAKRISQGKVFGIDLWHTKDQSGNGPESALSNAKIEGVLEKVEIETGDLRSLPYSEGSFDLVLSSLAIHNIEAEEDRKTALTELYRVLKPGGRIVLVDFRNIPKYAYFLHQMGAKEVEISPSMYRYFPPMRIVKAKRVSIN